MPQAASIDGVKITDEQVASNVKIFTFLAGLNGPALRREGAGGDRPGPRAPGSRSAA